MDEIKNNEAQQQEKEELVYEETVNEAASAEQEIIKEAAVESIQVTQVPEEKPYDPEVCGVPITLDNKNAQKMVKHMKFIAVMNITLGILLCMSVIMIPVGIFCIIAGTKLQNAARYLKTLVGGEINLPQHLIGEELSAHFKQMGIMWIVSIGILILGYICIIIYNLIMVLLMV